jgi:SAM-dependent MidA family methyltransferase
VKAQPAITPLQQQFVKSLHAQGRITFADYMRECLYHPEFGYYSRPEAQRFADFYTSVDVHPIFGRLLARQLAEMWQVLGCPAEFFAVEAGAGTGRLAAQILDFAARELPDFYQALRYVAVEQSAARRAAHGAAFGAHVSAGRAASAAQLPAEIAAGCVLSNELLDALPVHRVVVKSGDLREVYVGLRAGRAREEMRSDRVVSDQLQQEPRQELRGELQEELQEELGPLSSPEVAEYFLQQGIELREGQQAEAGLDACRWILDVGRRLDRGFVLTVDYGHEAAELYNERHMRGTLLAYSKHRVSEDYLLAPGEQDLTAHVNFTALNLWGSRAGLARTGCVSQMAFLVAMGRTNEFADLYLPGASEVERVRARLLLKTLLHPAGMGETFHVCIHHKGIAAPRLTGLSGI